MNLCQFEGRSCFGCCGNSYKSVEEIKKDVKLNTDEFQTCSNLEEFRDRYPKWSLRPSGVCRNVIDINGEIFCPLHPERNNGKDKRENHCEIEYLCKTFQAFKEWNKEKRKKFLEFVKKKNLDSYRYSILMDSNKLLEEFEKTI